MNIYKRLEDKSTRLNLQAVYCPPKHYIQKEYNLNYFRSLGNRFMAAGYFNAIHQQWRSRITRTDGRQILAAIQANNMNYLQTGVPTYWPTDRTKIPDLTDFAVTKRINTRMCDIYNHVLNLQPIAHLLLYQ